MEKKETICEKTNFFQPDWWLKILFRRGKVLWRTVTLKSCHFVLRGIWIWLYLPVFNQTAASVAQLGEQRFCKPQVVGSSPSAGSFGVRFALELRKMGGYRSGQTGQTVNLLAQPSQVRILHPPLGRLAWASWRVNLFSAA